MACALSETTVFLLETTAPNSWVSIQVGLFNSRSRSSLGKHEKKSEFKRIFSGAGWMQLWALQVLWPGVTSSFFPPQEAHLPASFGRVCKDRNSHFCVLSKQKEGQETAGAAMNSEGEIKMRCYCQQMLLPPRMAPWICLKTLIFKLIKILRRKVSPKIL